MADETKKRDDGTPIRILRRTKVTVNAKHSLWFAWAPDLNANPGPEGEDESSRPEFDVVEDGASQVRIRATNLSQKWRHHPSPARESGAGGLDGTGGIPNDQRGLENLNYQSAQYNSEHLQQLRTHLNKLVAVFEINGEAPTQQVPAVQEPVGADRTLDIPLNATRLFLGFHDGRQWTNNDFNVDVEVEWIV